LFSENKKLKHEFQSEKLKKKRNDLEADRAGHIQEESTTMTKVDTLNVIDMYLR
jgi:hypothetical protein